MTLAVSEAEFQGQVIELAHTLGWEQVGNVSSTMVGGENTSEPGAASTAPARGQHLVGGAVMAKRTCSVDGCGRPVQCRGWCVKHYARWRRRGGDPAERLTGGSPVRSLADRMEQKIHRTETCWVWTGSLNPEGYGKVYRDGTSALAHRAFYELHVGPVPEGLSLDHLCRNRACVRPSHLEPVTRGENSLRGEAPMIQVHRSGACARGHDRSIHGYFRPDGRYGSCRECRREDRRDGQE